MPLATGSLVLPSNRAGHPLNPLDPAPGDGLKTTLAQHEQSSLDWDDSAIQYKVSISGSAKLLAYLIFLIIQPFLADSSPLWP